MRKVILGLAVSLDGYIARENGDVDWLRMEDLTEGAKEAKEFHKTIDAIFLGRKTYRKGLEMGGNFGGIDCYVFSRTPSASAEANPHFISENVKERVEEMKRREGKNILLMGGGNLAKTFFAEDLIDELILGIQPVILGKGIPLFLPLERLIELERYDVKSRASGTVQISYRIRRTL
jgi:dihydrofolate reductase